jgi:hypothetical protein
MKRLLVAALVAALGNAAPVFAGESLLTSGARHVQRLAAAEPTVTPTAGAPAAAPAGTAVTVGTKRAPSFQAEGGTLSKSGMGKGTKTLIYVGLAVGVAASFWAIDHHVLDITPSSLGTRQD